MVSLTWNDGRLWNGGLFGGIAFSLALERERRTPNAQRRTPNFLNSTFSVQRWVFDVFCSHGLSVISCSMVATSRFISRIRIRPSGPLGR